jgi:hypothetical protein
MKEGRFVCNNGKEIEIHNGCRSEEIDSSANIESFNFINYMISLRQPLWSGGQSSWPQNGDVLCFL